MLQAAEEQLSQPGLMRHPLLRVRDSFLVVGETTWRSKEPPVLALVPRVSGLSSVPI